jgi:hypothetical protein
VYARQPVDLKVVVVALAAALLVSACSNNAASPPAGDPSIVAGVWDWTEHFADASSGVTCDDTGTYVFTVAGTGFVGRSDQVGTCATPSGPVDNTSSDTVIGGSVTDVQMRFTVGLANGCQYSAALPSTPDHLSGTATCGSTPGTWTADRGQALSSLALSPDSTSIPVGAVFVLQPVLRNALGNRVFGRAVTWSSDTPAVADVDSLGLLTAHLLGTAHIQAAAAGLSGVAAITVAGVSEPDSVGDAFGAAPLVDVLSLSAASDSSDMTVVIRFSAPPGTAVYGLLDLDVDQDSTTGVAAQVDLYRPDTTQSSGLGDEFVCEITTGGLFDAATATLLASVPVYYDAPSSTVTVRIPVALLGSARANMAVVVGNASVATDIAPNAGHLTLYGPTLTAGLASAAPRTVVRGRLMGPWGAAVRAPLPARVGRGKIP